LWYKFLIININTIGIERPLNKVLMLLANRRRSLRKIAAICILAAISATTIFQVYGQSNGQSSQNGMIIGHVIDLNGQPAAGVEISYFIEDAVKANRASGSGIITDSDGDYTIKYTMSPVILQLISESYILMQNLKIKT
jgi:hypothetical protein